MVSDYLFHGRKTFRSKLSVRLCSKESKLKKIIDIFSFAGHLAPDLPHRSDLARHPVQRRTTIARYLSATALITWLPENQTKSNMKPKTQPYICLPLLIDPPAARARCPQTFLSLIQR